MTQDKAFRLLAEGCVDPEPAPARIFYVQGQQRYTVVISACHRSCTCPWGVSSHAHKGDCSHIKAAIEWILSEGALHDETQKGESLSLCALRFPVYLDALARRKKAAADLAEDLFRRLA